jgi:hypothetical protein
MLPETLKQATEQSETKQKKKINELELGRIPYYKINGKLPSTGCYDININLPTE